MDYFSDQEISKILFVLVLVFGFPLMANAQTGVRVSDQKADIYSDPKTDAAFQIRAQQGDIFEVQEDDDKWVRINLFSGGERYIKKSQVEVVHGVASYPSHPATRSQLCNRAEEARGKASQNALSQYSDDMSRQGTYEKMLFDKYMMRTFRESGIPAAHYSKLAACVDHGILPSVRIEN